MTFIHIVLLKVKSDIWVNGNGKDELIQKLAGLKELPIVKSHAQELAWGPPVFTERAKDWSYGLFSRFASRKEYEEYAQDEQHRELVTNVIRPNCDDVLSYDFEY
ncbi:unnamed protein product [Jaminaea pallidilutea]